MLIQERLRLWFIGTVSNPPKGCRDIKFTEEEEKEGGGGDIMNYASSKKHYNYIIEKKGRQLEVSVAIPTNHLAMFH